METTQSQHPWRATLRTAVQVLLAFASAIPIAVGEQGFSGPVITWVVAASVVITRVWQSPLVTSFIEKYLPWLAAAPVKQES